MLRFSVVCLLSAFFLASCANERLSIGWLKPDAVNSPSQGNFKVGKPYSQGGKWYTPTESYSYDETGISSWYGDEFHGKRTANGEIFDKNAMTAAHPTLQLPALIRVTNLENGRSAVLRVNDRGPFSKSRLIDVSHKAANVLGYAGQGTARVRVQVLDRESRILADAARQGHSADVQMATAFRRGPTEITQQTQETVQVASADNAMPSTMVTNVVNTQVVETDLTPPQNVTKTEIEELNKELFRKYPVSPTSIYIQVGAFANAGNANALKPRLSPLGNVNVYQTTVNGQLLNRVRIGPVATVVAADNLLKKTINAGFPAARIVVD